MYGNLIGSTLFLILGSLTAGDSVAMESQNLVVHAICRDNPRCEFNGEDIFLDISVTNNSNAPLSVPMDYIRKRGPTIKLVDNVTSRETYLRPNLADPSLADNVTQLEPGKSLALEWVISSAELSQFNLATLDVTAEIRVDTSLDPSAAGSLHGTGKLRICGGRKK